MVEVLLNSSSKFPALPIKSPNILYFVPSLYFLTVVEKLSLNVELLSNTKGNYTLKLDLEKGGVTYYYEQKLFL